MAVHVVYLFEVIEIDHAIGHREAARIGKRAQIVGGGRHAATVEASGKRVCFGKFAGKRFCSAALSDFDLEFAISTPSEDDQSDIEEQRVDQQDIGRRAAAECGIDRFWQDRASGRHEKDYRGGRNTQRD